MAEKEIRVLMVEDSLVQAGMVRRLISGADANHFRIEHVTRFSDALARLRAHGTDVVLLDMTLPDSSGIDSVGRLLGEAPEVPIVVLTGSNDKSLAMKAVEEGAQDYLLKRDVNGELIIRSIIYAIERQRILRQLQVAKGRLETENKRMEQELRMARRVQQQLMSKRLPESPGLLIHRYMKTAQELGGDFYDFILAEDEKPGDAPLYICAGDVTGNGVSAGLIMVLALGALRSSVLSSDSTHRALVEVNKALKGEAPRDMFVSMILLRWDPGGTTLRYTAAGSEKPLLYRHAQREVKVLETKGIVLGIRWDVSALLQERSVVLSPGDAVLLYSDGVTEAMNANHEEFTIRRLREALLDLGHLDPRPMIDGILGRVRDFVAGAGETDDLTLVALKKT